jgi:hypothetical protein
MFAEHPTSPRALGRWSAEPDEQALLGSLGFLLSRSRCHGRLIQQTPADHAIGATSKAERTLEDVGFQMLGPRACRCDRAA